MMYLWMLLVSLTLSSFSRILRYKSHDLESRLLETETPRTLWPCTKIGRYLRKGPVNEISIASIRFDALSLSLKHGIFFP